MEASGESRGAWVHRKIALDAHAGTTTASFRLAASTAKRGPLAFYVDDVVIRRASSAPIVLFDEGAVSARREAPDRMGQAACFTWTRPERYPERYVPAGSEIPGEPWVFVELAAARRALGAHASGDDAASRVR